MLMIFRPAKSRNFLIVIYGIVDCGLGKNAVQGPVTGDWWQWGNGRKSVAIGGFDEKENINKIICQNISKQLCKLRTLVEYRCLLPFVSHNGRV